MELAGHFAAVAGAEAKPAKQEQLPTTHLHKTNYRSSPLKLVAEEGQELGITIIRDASIAFKTHYFHSFAVFLLAEWSYLCTIFATISSFSPFFWS